MANELALSMAFGAAGGIVRGLVGLAKAETERRKVLWANWGVTTAIAAIIGASMGVMFSFEWHLTPLAGYAGLDILDGIYKIFRAEKLIVKTP
jgi:hypothetical protein